MDKVLEVYRGFVKSIDGAYVENFKKALFDNNQRKNRITHKIINHFFTFNKSTNEFRSKDGKCLATKIGNKIVLMGITDNNEKTGQYINYGEYESLRDAVRFYIDNIRQ